MSQEPKTDKRPILELIGQLPEMGTYICATCAQMYLGAVSESPEIVTDIRERIRKATAAGVPSVRFVLPVIKDKPLRQAVTIAPSNYLVYPAPVCWVHMLPMTQSMTAAEPIRSPIIPGSGNWQGMIP